jgi:hypothetical protein
LNNLDYLIQATYQDIIKKANAIEHLQNELDQVSHLMNISIEIIIMLIKLR